MRGGKILPTPTGDHQPESVPMLAAQHHAAQPAASTHAHLIAAARDILQRLSGSAPITSRDLARALTTATGRSDADGGWNWKDAYDAAELARCNSANPTSENA